MELGDFQALQANLETEDSLGILKAIQMKGRALKQGETGGFC